MENLERPADWLLFKMHPLEPWPCGSVCESNVLGTKGLRVPPPVRASMGGS